MATLSLSPTHHNLGNTPRRVPLGIVSNATNSPFRGTAAKRTRDQVDAQEDFPWDVQPNAKRQALNNNGQQARRTSPRKPSTPLRFERFCETVEKMGGCQAFEPQLFTKNSNAPPTTLERQLLAARDERKQQRVDRQEKITHQTAKGIKQWQEHYRRAFPMFVFYFEGVPEEVRMKCSKYARVLGAREEKFFSKEVTHVVTTRDIPTDTESLDTAGMTTTSSTSNGLQVGLKSRTINPSLLEHPGELTYQAPIKSKFTFEATLNKRPALNAIREVEQRKGIGGNTDILLKAKEMGMKVWQLEKFQRMIKTMLETPNETQPAPANRSRNVPVTNKGSREADLSKMLRNERLNGPSDRDSTVALNELIPFKGPFIYVRDMDERSKPILVRDYQRPPKGELGDWPQFHGVGAGRCPFIPDLRDDPEDETEHDRERELQRRNQARAAPLTRASNRKTEVQNGQRAAVPIRAPLQESQNAVNSAVLPKQSPMKASPRNFCPPPPFVARKTLSHSQIDHEISNDPAQRLIGGEPAASGMQPSNITSAIRSQMISSTAAAPGTKAGTSKEVHGLQRKVLQKNVGPALTSNQSRGSTLDPTAVTRAERAIPASRQTRRQTQSTIIHQDDDSTQSEEEDVWMAENVRHPEAKKKKRSNEKGTKTGGRAGYCENCREKYDDFDTHVISRKHRKFALTKDNWKDLDRLLGQLGRRLKEPDSDSF